MPYFIELLTKIGLENLNHNIISLSYLNSSWEYELDAC